MAAGMLQRAQQAQNAKAQNLAEAGKPPRQPQGAPGQGVESADEQMSPEEIKSYEQGLDTASKLLYQTDAITQKVAAMLKGGQPGQAIGDTAAMLTKQADDALQGALLETVIIPLGVHLVGEIADFGEELQLIQTDAPMLKQALQVCIKRLLTDYGVDDAGAQIAQQLAQQFGGSKDFTSALSEVGRDNDAAGATAPAPAPQQGAPAPTAAAPTDPMMGAA